MTTYCDNLSDGDAADSAAALLNEIENLLYSHTACDRPWVSIATVREQYQQQYGVSLDSKIDCLGGILALRDRLSYSGRFALYGTAVPQTFYVALFSVLKPGSNSSRHRSTFQIKKGWRVEGRLVKTLRREGAQEIPPRFPKPRRPRPHRP